MNKEKEYDVSQYSDDELYQVLDLNHPTDRELEAQIIQQIAKYESKDSPESEKLHRFFEEVYEHFFQTSDEETEGFSTIINQNAEPIPLREINSSNKRPTYTTNVETGPSQINPLLKDTMKRVIFIDSQFRNYNLYPSSTDFRFNLSEPLHNAISLKLHSVAIPYTWYNISNMYTANYFVLVGNKTGMDKKIVIPIEPGTYTEPTLLNTLNQSIAAVALLHPEVNFGTTQIIYSSVHNKIQFQLDLTYDNGTTIYRTEDFNLVFFKPNGSKNQQSVEENYDYEFVTWDVTLGWVLGYRNYTQYDLDPTSTNNSQYVTQNNYTFNSTTHIVTLTANTCLDLNTCKTMYLIVNDYTNHHLNDGLITLEAPNNNIDYQSYINKGVLSQNLDTTINVAAQSAQPYQILTENQVYAANATVYDRQQNTQNAAVYSEPPFLKDMFAVIPLKLAGLKPGQVISEFGGGLLENSRIYFGPVHVKKMHVQLMNDKGDVMNLNNANWNFSLVVEYLYNYNRT